VVYSTYLGGSGYDLGNGIAVDAAGSAYVTGTTASTNFPAQSAYQATFQGTSDAFVTKLPPAGNALVYSTFLGGSGEDWARGIAVDGAGSAYVTGYTQSTNFPTQSPYQAAFQGGAYDAFVTKLQLPAAGAAITAVVDSASGLATIAPNSFVTIWGSNFTSWTGNWGDAIQNGVLPTTLGGVQVRINGRDCFLNYAQSNQLNVLTPSDTASGSVSVEVITAQGTATATAIMAPVAPALFGYTLPGKFYAVAQIATDMSILVAPVGTFPRPCRPAQAGEYVTLWALGMGLTNPAAPSGRVLETAYPISDLSRVTVRFGSVDAPVSWAGQVMAGLFQVNVLVPPGLSGDQPVVLTVDGHSTQPNAFLNFQ
jgi:uncharacterized protein (TIGR03437 family)